MHIVRGIANVPPVKWLTYFPLKKYSSNKHTFLNDKSYQPLYLARCSQVVMIAPNKFHYICTILSRTMSGFTPPLRLALYHILSMFITVNMALTPEFLSLLLVYIQIFAGEYSHMVSIWFVLYPINFHNIVGMISISPGEIPICKSSSHPVIRHLGAPNSVHGLVVEAPVLRTISLHQI